MTLALCVCVHARVYACAHASTVTWQCTKDINFKITSLLQSMLVLSKSSKSVFLRILVILHQELPTEWLNKCSMRYLHTLTTSVDLDNGSHVLSS